MVTTESRLKCVECSSLIPLDGAQFVWDNAGSRSPRRCLCLACYERWKQRDRSAVADEAERIARGEEPFDEHASPKAQSQTDIGGSEWEQC